MVKKHLLHTTIFSVCIALTSLSFVGLSHAQSSSPDPQAALSYLAAEAKVEQVRADFTELEKAKEASKATLDQANAEVVRLRDAVANERNRKKKSDLVKELNQAKDLAEQEQRRYDSIQADLVGTQIALNNSLQEMEAAELALTPDNVDATPVADVGSTDANTNAANVEDADVESADVDTNADDPVAVDEDTESTDADKSTADAEDLDPTPGPANTAEAAPPSRNRGGQADSPSSDTAPKPVDVNADSGGDGQGNKAETTGRSSESGTEKPGSRIIGFEGI